MNAGFLLEALVAALLGATIYFCWQLNRRLTGLRGGQDELRVLIENLNEATRRAQAAIAEIRMSSDAAGARLAAQVTGARQLADELTLIVEAGNNLADRVSGGLSGLAGKVTPFGPPPARPVPPPRPSTTGSAPQGAAPASPLAPPAADGGPSELLRALREVR